MSEITQEQMIEKIKDMNDDDEIIELHKTLMRSLITKKKQAVWPIIVQKII